MCALTIENGEKNGIKDQLATFSLRFVIVDNSNVKALIF